MSAVSPFFASVQNANAVTDYTTITNAFRYVGDNRYMVAPSPRVRGQWQFTILSLFGAFLGNVAANVVSDYVIDFIDDLRGENDQLARCLQVTYDDMIRFGFTDDTAAEVSELPADFICFPMVSPDGFNCCAPFNKALPNTCNDPALIEGPTVAGVGVGSTDLHDALREIGRTEDEAADFTGRIIIPRSQTSAPEVTEGFMPFNQSWQSPARYETQAGTLEIMYSRIGETSNSNVGLIDVVARISGNGDSEPIEIGFEPFEIEYPREYNDVEL